MAESLEATGGELCGGCSAARAGTLMTWLDLTDDE
jgi:hypothetical protein